MPEPAAPTLSWLTIAELLAKYALPEVDQIIQNVHDNAVPTPETWAALKAKLATPFKQL